MSETGTGDAGTRLFPVGNGPRQQAAATGPAEKPRELEMYGLGKADHDPAAEQERDRFKAEPEEV